MSAPTATAPESVEPRHTNRLIEETSPYLLQHANNPVNWYSWGPEAFEAARAQGKPIFLSIGYSTCYWCHVMERESFENEAIAAIMNEHFISIKVDREERPDVDDIYMAATQALNRGQGGWPMSVFLDPHTLKPFIAGTYFPPQDRQGMPGFPNVLTQVARLWADSNEDMVRQADQVAQLVERHLSLAAEPAPLGQEQIERAVAVLLDIYDERDGGFGAGGNKFPMPAYLDLLMGVAWDRPQVQKAVRHTLDRMAMGGMYDHIGGGFHRYSTDTKWLVPHFEKMLYDNGQLASTYAAAYERTGDPYYARIVRETLDYVLREMTDATGAFYSAQDAEVNTREGGNYVWVADEVTAALKEAGLSHEVELALDIYGFDRGTNFQDPHHPEDGRKNVVYLRERPQPLAESRELAVEELNGRLDRINAALLRVRDRRDQPRTDDKILVGWNGLMIAGMADGARVLEDPKYLEAARRAMDFLLTTLADPEGGLLRTYRAGQAKVSAVLEDYALLIRGLVALYRATSESRYLQEAVRLAEAAKERFWDAGSGAYYDTLPDQADLFMRTKSTYDGAVPCGNSVMLNNLLDLYEITSDEAYLADATSALQGLSSAVAQNPVSAALSTLALSRFVDDHSARLAWQPAKTKVPIAKDVVALETTADRVLVGPDAPATLELTLRIADTYHINAHEPGPSNLIGLNVQLVGVEGLVLYPEYPAGDLYRGEIRIHRGEVTLPLRIEQTGPAVGDPRLVVTYQVCTDRLCLAPTTLVLPVEIVVGEGTDP